jgi:hypothetical protein
MSFGVLFFYKENIMASISLFDRKTQEDLDLALRSLEGNLYAPIVAIDGELTIPENLATTLSAGVEKIGKVITPSFSVSDSLTRPNNTTAYAVNKTINCNVLVTAMSYSGLVVTLTGPNAFSVGDRITVAGVNTGFTVTNIDGNWICKTGTNATTIVFDVLVQPTGTTPQTVTAGTVSKLLSVEVADANGNAVILSRINVGFQGVAMTGSFRLYVYDSQVGALVDQSTFTLLNANVASRLGYYDLSPVTDGSGSDATMAVVRLWEVLKCAANDKRLYFRIVAEAASTPVANAVVTIKLTGIQLLG